MRIFVLFVLLCAAAARADIHRHEAAELRPADPAGQRENIMRQLEAENNHLHAFLESEKALGVRLAGEMDERRAEADYRQYWNVSDVSYRKTPAGKFFRVERFSPASNTWVLVIDAQQRAQEQLETRQGRAEHRQAADTVGFYVLRTPVISPDNRYALLAEDRLGNEVYALSVWDIQARRQVGQSISYVAGQLAWATDSRHFYYLQTDPHSGRPLQLKQGVLAEHEPAHGARGRQGADRVVFDVGSHYSDLNINVSSSGAMLILTMTSVDGEVIKLLNLHESRPALVALQGLDAQAENFADHAADGFYMRSNRDGRYALYYAKDRYGHWKKIFTPPNQGEFESFQVLRDWVIAKVRVAGVIQVLYWRKAQPDAVQRVPFPDSNYLVWMPSGSAGDVLALGYTSPAVPRSLVKFDMGKQQWLTAWPAGSDAYQTDYFTVPVRDGTQVPVTLIRRKSFAQNASTALLVTGYGAYGFSLSPVYGTFYKSLLDRGFVYAIIHVRGGGELGASWHEQGRGRNKKNSFNDFVDVTRHLQQRFRAQGRTYAMGESAGGLLIAASMIADPALYSGVVLHVPFLDVSGAMAVARPATGELERAEWGRMGNAQDLAYIDSYSPYQTLGPGCYPPILMIAARHDARTPYTESLQFLRKMRHGKCADQTAFLFTETGAGHAGTGDRSARHVMSYQFILKLDRTSHGYQQQTDKK